MPTTALSDSGAPGDEQRPGPPAAPEPRLNIDRQSASASDGPTASDQQVDQDRPKNLAGFGGCRRRPETARMQTPDVCRRAIRQDGRLPTHALQEATCMAVCRRRQGQGPRWLGMNHRQQLARLCVRRNGGEFEGNFTLCAGGGRRSLSLAARLEFQNRTGCCHGIPLETDRPALSLPSETHGQS